MQVISYTQARKSLEAVIDQVIEHKEAALIRRREGGNVVLLPEQTYNSMQETLHLLSTSANAQRLLRSADQLNACKAKTSLIRVDTFTDTTCSQANNECTTSFMKQTS